MRLFVAINLNDDIKDALVDIQDTIRTHGIRGRETPPENMHMTLAFIGEFNDPDLVKEVVDSIEVSPFQIKISGVGASMTVDHISLMRSDRGKYGMIYTEL